MARIKVDLMETLVDGMDIKFQAPCDCTAVTGLVVYYPTADETIVAKELIFRDAHGNDLTGIGNLFAKGAYVKVIADATNGYAYIQNATNNGYLNSAIFGTYTHDAENLIGSGENGKFKATVSGTISSIKVNGVSYSVKCGEDTSMDLVAGCWYTFILDGNTVNFNSGGAGGGLNFKVVGDTTQPVSPSENMIWVNTEKIGSYYFSSTQPEGMQDWDVWISTGTSSTIEFNALKKNGIQVCPISAKQYVGGKWGGVTAKIYQNGQWNVLWDGKLYDAGFEYPAVTGGWTLLRGEEYFSKSDNAMHINSTNTKDVVVLFTGNKVDLSRFSTLYVEIANCSVINSNSSANVSCGYSTEKVQETYVGSAQKAKARGDFTMKVPLPAKQNSPNPFYIQVACYMQKFDITKIWFE